MKRKARNALRVICLLGLLIAVTALALHIHARHQADCPQLYTDAAEPGYLPLILGGALFLLLPLAQALILRASGCRVMETSILFLNIRWTEKPCLRLARPGLGTWYLPPRLDGTSPCLLPLLSAPLYTAGTSLLCTLLLIPCWETPMARILMTPAFVLFAVTLALLLPRRNGTDLLSRALILRRSRDLVRAWECAVNIAHALHQGKKLLDMPDEWFQRYPAALAEDLYASICMVNGASRLMRQYRFPEAYDMLRPLFDLQPGPDTHQTIACAILNGAICEALAELPPMCLSQLDHTSVKYMTPPGWEPRLLLAKYARALFLTHDESEAAALLPQIEQSAANGKTDPHLVRILQEKAGLFPPEKEIL